MKRLARCRWLGWFASTGAWVATALVAMAPATHGQVLSFSPDGQRRLAALVNDDPKVAALFQSLTRTADSALKESPQPVKQILSEGRLESDPAKQQTRAAMRDMPKIHALGQCFAVTGRADYARGAGKFILAWATTTEPTGNPIDATSLDPLIETYDLIRATLARNEQQTIDVWLEQIARRQISDRKPMSSSGANNWQSHRLKIVGLIGCAIRNRELFQAAISGFHEQIAANLQPDGSSFDFHERDALHYHCYTLEPLLKLAIAAQQRGVGGLYTYVAPNGASLQKSVAFLIPFAEGKQTHAEYVNSNVEFDRRRAAAGQKGYEIGKPFDPQDARTALGLAAFFEPQLETLVSALLEKSGRQAKTWQMALNEVGRQEATGRKAVAPRRPVSGKKPASTRQSK